ncbi:MAG: hypothetical protein KY456_00255 [Chloroflexi bacterium]|nr:hypothetical protein [Chloroflexota bacterium]
MPRPSIVSALALSALLALGAANPTAAQDSTSLPVTPDPAECTAEPVTIDELLSLTGATPIPGTPSAGTEGETAATPGAFALPEGEPADEETVTAVTASLREALACLNTGNFLTAFAFFSEDFQRRDLEEFPITEADVAFFEATPEPLPAEFHASLLAVREARVLEDGRVGALVETIFPDEAPGPQVDFIIFVQEDGRWLLDEIIEDLEAQYPPTAATPTS